MLPRFSIPTYSSKDVPILVATVLPLSALFNYYIFGSDYFDKLHVFLGATIVSSIYYSAIFLLYGIVAISLRTRFPLDSQLSRRLTICISIFFLMSAVTVSLLLLLFDAVHFFGYVYSDNDFIYCYFTLITINVFLTFLNEGVYRFDKYRANITETEQLKKEYLHSRLLSLKSQMNPHFLFNSLNTLSSLITEDDDRAETFLDHMSKVYRYQLRHTEEQLVSLRAELEFISSYAHLLKARHEHGLVIRSGWDDSAADAMIPPMTLQMLIEHIIQHNSISKDSPLVIMLAVTDNTLTLRHPIFPKHSAQEQGQEVMENIFNKYRLLCHEEPLIRDDAGIRTIRLPFINAQIPQTA